MTQPVWVTPKGSIGIFPFSIPANFQLVATPVLPAVSLTYQIISGSLPNGLSMNSAGLISGTPVPQANGITFQIVVRVTDNLLKFADRTFSLKITGSVVPEFTTPNGSLLTTQDSIWVELQINYQNIISTNPVSIRVVQGTLPPGLEINELGLIRGYAEPPIITVTVPTIITSINETSASSDEIKCLSTNGFTTGRPIFFTGTAFGGLEVGKIYYVQSIVDETHFKISFAPGDVPVQLNDGSGYMTTTLPNISTGQPTIKNYSFTLKLESPLGSDLESYSILVINQNAPPALGGPGKPPGTRVPTLLNTRPLTYNVYTSIDDYAYYLFPNNINGVTYPTTSFAYIGLIESDNYFAFKILGKDFDNNSLKYVYSNLPLGLEGDVDTGWITGNPIIPDETIDDYNFSVQVYKSNNPSILSSVFNFTFKLYNDIKGIITWVTPSNLGEMFNGSVSDKRIVATSDTDLSYSIISGSLPPNLTLLSNGEITGFTAYQPTNVLLSANTKTNFTFTVRAYSPTFDVVTDTRTFTLTVVQEFTQPTDKLYIKCTPNINDRIILDSLLFNETLIPSSYLYRADDINYGKATNVTYMHAYGINASNLNEYIEAVTKNHYWRNITLGQLSTAVARNEEGEIIYEVVYSNIIDNLVNLKNPPQSVSKEIYWPRFIDLSLGPWYTSVTDIYTSYGSIDGTLTFYTSLTPGYARLLYPNSLPNMREQVGDELGQQFDFRLLPSWMTSQQLNGSTLGFVPAWVICYTKPGFSETIKNNIENNWKNEYGKNYRLNEINFEIDRFTVDKTITFNYDNNFNPPAWTQLPSATPTPNPQDSKDFYVLFPRQTILPNKSQY